ncbi:translation initiation factor IF-5A [Methanonatronarchaeum sp. AMET-Sl]|uniref:translation initiation factor IF-5A n=1 Tax=Methanonatronarchaeum sp. AMET-Sl TaxID=3037654 RepID=UPI00244DA964|nr:translation initiation factor IF-5A [Methanonatronarchaeum sp. AMET-Sl]WGI17366.1 translation initiation factor IF-5A [Methanonatronarchaeum sp. AMET-Sl]
MSKRRTEIRNLDEGDYILLDGEPSKITDLQVSSPGKHGSAKANISAKGIFDDKKRNMLNPVDTKVDVPIVERKDAQVISKTENTVQLMDMETYETFEILVEDQDILNNLEEGGETKYMSAMGKNKILNQK